MVQNNAQDIGEFNIILLNSQFYLPTYDLLIYTETEQQSP